MTKRKKKILSPSELELQAMARPKLLGGDAAIARAVRISAAQSAKPAMQPGYDGKRPLLVEVAGITKEERAAKVTLKRNINENPMDRLFSQHLIGAEQREAGLRLIADWELSQIGAPRGAELGCAVTGGGARVSLADAKCDAIRRLQRALTAAGHSGRVLLIAAVIDGENFQQVAGRVKCSPRGVLPALRVALDALVSHYRLGRGEDAG